MADSAALDRLRDSTFYLFDIAPIDAISLPLFIPLFGFTQVSSPELTLEVQQIVEGNKLYPHDVVKGASVGAISISRGVTAVDSDFWRWTTAAARGYTGGISAGFAGPILEVGGVTYRRNLLLVHFFRNQPFTGAGAKVAALVGDAFVLGAALEDLSEQGVGAAGLVGGGIYGAANLAFSQNLFTGDPNTTTWVPARAFLLRNCIPTRYKAGSDYDANSGQVSIAELEFAVESFEEIALAA